MDRYEKQILFKGIGVEGQKKIMNSKVLIIGCGALGTTISNALVRAGVGYIKILDRDYIELSNLQRQLLFDEKDIEKNLPKAIAAKRKLELINSEITIESELVDVNPTNIEGYIKGMDLVVDATDNFNTRFLINDTAIKYNIPWIYGGVLGSMGVVSPIIPGKTHCFRCIMPEIPPSGSVATCDTVGIINAIPHIIGSLEATEALKILSGNYDKVLKGMMYIDIWDNSCEIFEVGRRENCQCCGNKNFEFLSRKAEDAISLCGRNSVQINPFNQKISIDDIIQRLNNLGIDCKKTSYFIRFEVEGVTFTLFYDGRAILKNVNDINKAKTLYSKYIGY